MTHLYIELNTGLTEEVNSSIIAKLYELAISGDLDNTSDLKGRLHSTTAKRVEVQYLMAEFSGLYITVDLFYKYFVDPAVDEFFAKCPAGDGKGMLESEWNKLNNSWGDKNTKYGYSNNANYFGISRGNDSVHKNILERVEHFPELIDLPFALNAYDNMHYAPICQHFKNIKEIYCPKDSGCHRFVVEGSSDDFSFDKLELIDYSTCDAITDTCFLVGNCYYPKMKKVVLPPATIYFSHGVFNKTTGDSSGIDVFAYTTDISNAPNDSSTWVFTGTQGVRLWVQDSVYNDWLSHRLVVNSSNITVKKFSEYTGDDLVQKWLPLTT